jgi:hypothetical protein
MVNYTQRCFLTRFVEPQTTVPTESRGGKAINKNKPGNLPITVIVWNLPEIRYRQRYFTSRLKSLPDFAGVTVFGSAVYIIV